MDTSAKPHAANIRNAERRLLDSEGKLLASAKSDDKFGVVRLIHPEAGGCSAAEKNASSSPAARQQWAKLFSNLVAVVDRLGGKDSVSGREVCGLRYESGAGNFAQEPSRLVVLVGAAAARRRQAAHVFSLSINIDDANCAARAS
jgi:hypothetical protein